MASGDMRKSTLGIALGELAIPHVCVRERIFPMCRIYGDLSLEINKADAICKIYMLWREPFQKSELIVFGKRLSALINHNWYHTKFAK